MTTNLDEINEVYESNTDPIDDPENEIIALQEKVMRLEKMNQELKAKNEDLKKK